MSRFKTFLIVSFITLLALIIRILNISSVPPGLTWDEAALGYNAYSLLTTGKDEYGKEFPVNLKSFGDFKPGLYAYLAIPSIKAFGLNEFGIRIPSVIFGVGLVLVTYFFSLELFKRKDISIVCAAVMSVSPFAIQFSRPAFEANLALFLNVLGSFLFIKGSKIRYFYLISFFIFGLSVLAYQASKLFVPLILILFILIYKKSIKLDRFLITGVATFFIFLSLVYFLVLVEGQGLRLSSMNYFAYSRSLEQINQIKSEGNLTGLSHELLHGEWFSYTKGLFERYLIYFSPQLLFVQGDYNPRFKVPDLGILYYHSMIFIFLGIAYLLKMRGDMSKLIFAWFLISPIPAVLSRDLISSVRALNLLLPLTLFEGVGFYVLVKWLSKYNKLVFYITTLAIFSFVFFNLVQFLDRYFVHSSIKYSQGWLYGYKEAIQYLEFRIKNKKYDKVVVTDYYGQPHIFYLFYTSYPPLDFQKQAKLEQPSADVGTVRKIDGIEFRHIYWPQDRGEKNGLFVGTLEELPDQDVIPFQEYKILKDINFLDKSHAFRIVETK